MSPLSPQMNNIQRFNHSTSQHRSLIDPRLSNNEPKVVYSLADLHGMRHNQSRVPNLGNRNVLSSISRTDAVPGANFPNIFNFNLMSSALGQTHGDRRTQHQYRSAPRHQNQHNGGHMNSDGNYGERYRQPNRGDRGYARGGAPNSVQVRLSIREDVKLKEAENAWKPSFLQKSQPNDVDNSAELYKQVRLILNKLTAKNFGVLSAQFQSLQIDTKEKLVEVINLVFNKAVNEPNFSEGYAKLSQYLSHCSKQIDSSSTERAHFKRTLINKCEIEFKQHVANKNTTEAALAPLKEKLQACEKQADLNGANEIKAMIAEEESTLRRRLVSTVRFIGELYKLDMLTTTIMNVCIDTLLREAAPNQANSNQANEKLECLCKLLTTVGAKLERKPASNVDKTKAQNLDLTEYMNQLKCIADNKIRNFKASTRIKFMIMDVIELRNNKWKPKITMAQIQMTNA